MTKSNVRKLFLIIMGQSAFTRIAKKNRDL